MYRATGLGNHDGIAKYSACITFGNTVYTLQDWAGTVASLLLYKAAFVFCCQVDISAITAWIDVGLALHNSYVL